MAPSLVKENSGSGVMSQKLLRDRLPGGNQKETGGERQHFEVAVASLGFRVNIMKREAAGFSERK
jgi:hypothetical protein